MLAPKINEMRDYLHALACYHFFITPLNLPIPKAYRIHAEKACEYLLRERSEIIHIETPRHHVIHHFAQPGLVNAKKVLVTHGWMSRSAYMACVIEVLRQQGFDVYALDFPAHGEATGVQLPWIEAVDILRQTINQLGPFYGVMGHSFGGSMLLHTLNLSQQHSDYRLDYHPERVIFMASPTRMRTPVGRAARLLKLNGNAYRHLRQVFRDQSDIDIDCLNFRQYKANLQTKILCVHGQKDVTITPKESIIFCQHHPFASLALIPEVDHINILMDRQVLKTISEFLKP